jgi:hypothetical protein
MLKCPTCIYYNKKLKTCRIFKRLMEHKTDVGNKEILAADCVKNPSLCGPNYKKYQEKWVSDEK